MFFGDGESYRGEGDGADGGSGVQGLDLDSLEAQRMLKIFGIATLCYLCVQLQDSLVLCRTVLL